MAVMEKEKIKSVRITLLSKEEIESGIEITKEHTKNGPLENTIFDPRLGSVSPSKPCIVCSYPFPRCTGHPGYIKIPPIIHPLFAPEVESIVRFFCLKCNSFKLGNITPSSTVQSRQFAIIKKECLKVTTCQQCGNKIPTVNLDGNQLYIGDKICPENRIFEEDICTLFESIPDSVLKVIGLPKEDMFSDIRSLIITSLPVLPHGSRLSERKINDISVLYNNIIKFTKDYYDNKLGVATKRVTKKTRKPVDFRKRLEDEVCLLFKKPPKGARDVRNFITVLTGKKKTGLLIGAIRGKRNNFSARAPIAPGGLHLRVGETGIPEYITSRLHLGFQFVNGNYFYENWQKQLSKKSFMLDEYYPDLTVKSYYAYSKPKLPHRGIIYRTLENNDIIVFNRAPSLRDSNMLGTRVKILYNGNKRYLLEYYTILEEGNLVNYGRYINRATGTGNEGTRKNVCSYCNSKTCNHVFAIYDLNWKQIMIF